MSTHFDLGIIGCGVMGQIHAANFSRQPGVQVVALYDPCPERAERLKQKLDLDAVVCQSLEEVLERADAVVIAVPPNQTAQVVSAAARAGKPIFCEKPPGKSLADASRIVVEVRRAGVPCDIDFQYDVDAAALFIGQRLAAGDMGEVSALHFSHHNEDNNGDPEHARKVLARLAVESPFVDSGIHRVRLLERWLGPGEVLEAGGKAVRTDPLLPGVNMQSGWLVTRHACGVVTTFMDISWFTPGARKPRLDFGVDSPVHPFWVIVGTERTAYWLPRQRQVWLCGPDCDDPKVFNFPAEPDNYALKAQHFINCLRGEAEPTCPPKEARRALQLILALDRATRGGDDNAE